jgi:hypothetical protein
MAGAPSRAAETVFGGFRRRSFPQQNYNIDIGQFAVIFGTSCKNKSAPKELNRQA